MTTVDQAETDAQGTPDAVEFSHPFFAKLENLYFRLSDLGKEPVAMVKLGDTEVAMGFPGIKRELGLDPAHADAKMLDLIGQGLGFVRGIRPGDPLPRELVTRGASWAVSERAKRIARQRLTVQLVGWMSGDEHVFTDPEELQQIAEDPGTRRKVTKAFEEAAARLGLGSDGKEVVLGYVEGLASELSYIETQREDFDRIKAMEGKIQGLRKLYGHERSVLEVADPVARLMGRAVKDFGDFFMQVDAQTGEILGVLRNPTAHTEYIRAVRDELRKRLLAWDDILPKWDAAKMTKSPDKPVLLKETYQFLAPRFMQVNEWVLLGRLLERNKDKEPQGFSHMGVLGNEKIKMRKGGVMTW